ncbi:hemerythrin domain-containing protein [Caldimonas tepidiphila]|uniref:hemerythrin domain-containing protein n=1 Tax=Caldimonas tepidiphila TaxID=2315841 RepID=UPI00196BA7F4|nr:hemerythrin domain-containing protein [Caldimonas tepidiphila]
MGFLMNNLSPTVTNMIRFDHSHVLSTFQQFHAGTSRSKKQALVNSACLALEVHAQLEEEIFYPALRELAPDLTIIEKSYSEQAEMRRLIDKLRTLPPESPDYDATFMELMRDTLHHVADEETTMLPAAEQLLCGRLRELGAEMARRRLQLTAVRATELASNALYSFPQSAMVMAAGLMNAGAFLFSRTGSSTSHATYSSSPPPGAGYGGTSHGGAGYGSAGTGGYGGSSGTGSYTAGASGTGTSGAPSGYESAAPDTAAAAAADLAAAAAGVTGSVAPPYTPRDPRDPRA